MSDFKNLNHIRNIANKSADLLALFIARYKIENGGSENIINKYLIFENENKLKVSTQTNKTKEINETLSALKTYTNILLKKSNKITEQFKNIKNKDEAFYKKLENQISYLENEITNTLHKISTVLDQNYAKIKQKKPQNLSHPEIKKLIAMKEKLAKLGNKLHLQETNIFKSINEKEKAKSDIETMKKLENVFHNFGIALMVIGGLTIFYVLVTNVLSDENTTDVFIDLRKTSFFTKDMFIKIFEISGFLVVLDLVLRSFLYIFLRPYINVQLNLGEILLNLLPNYLINMSIVAIFILVLKVIKIKMVFSKQQLSLILFIPIVIIVGFSFFMVSKANKEVRKKLTEYNVEEVK